MKGIFFHERLGSYDSQRRRSDRPRLLFAPGAVTPNVVGDSAGVAEPTAAGVDHVGSAGTEARQAARHTRDNYGVLNGTQIYAPVDVPINLCGHALSILGLAQPHAACVIGGGHGESASQDPSGHAGIRNGTQFAAPISIPINVCGNALAVLGVGLNLLDPLGR
jgi:hypothetical protein